MDPWLEHPALWPDVHNRFVAAFGDELSPLVEPKYYVALERHVYRFLPDEIVLVGRPDVAIATNRAPATGPSRPGASGALEVDLLLEEEVGESYLEVREVETGIAVTVIELLSPANKLHAKGRKEYEEKRQLILGSKTSLIEIDLLRAGHAMPLASRIPATEYRVLVSRSWRRPKAQLWAFGMREPLPEISIPLAEDEHEPRVSLGQVVHGVYERARFHLRLRYDRPPEPPLRDEDAAWARERVAAARA